MEKVTELKEEIKYLLENFFYDKIVEAIAQGKRRIVLDFSEIERINLKIAENIIRNPEITISLFEKAISEIRTPTPEEAEIGRVERISVRFINLPESTKIRIRDIRSSHLNKMITIEGVVKAASDVRPIAIAVKYICEKCGWESDWRKVELLTKPRDKIICPHCKKAASVRILRKKLMDAQRLIVEEIPEAAEGQPKHINVLLLDDLVDPDLQKYTIPGKRVRISGILKEVPMKGKQMYDFIIVANWIEPLEKEFEEMRLSEEDIKKILELAKDPEIDKKIIRSIAPSIAGYEKVKEAIALQLFGGVKKKRPDGTTTRGDIHILLIGDPGTGKCVLYDTIIYVNNKKMEIGKFYERLDSNEKVRDGILFKFLNFDAFTQSFDESGRIRKDKIIAVTKRKYSGIIYKILVGKREICVTEDHPIFVLREDKFVPIPAKELREGDIVLVKEKSVIDGIPRDYKIESIRKIKKKNVEDIWVYDLQTKDFHNFLANDILIHNSQILKHVAALAPKGMYVSGKGVTGPGITATVVRDDVLGGWVLEAGPLVLMSGGILCIDELDKVKKEDIAALHEALEQQSYHPDFEIMLIGGKVKIGEFVDKLMKENKDKIIKGKDCEILNVSGIKVLTYDFNENKFKIVEAARVSRHKAPEIFYKVKLSNGREIIVTPNHPFFVFRGRVVEIPVEELKVGDFIPAPTKINLPEIFKVDKYTAQLLGYILSDGYTYENDKTKVYEIGFTNKDLSLIKRVKRIFNILSGKVPTIQVNNNGVYSVRLVTNDFYHHLKENYPEAFAKTKEERRIPQKIMFADERAKKWFIRAFFEGDGFYDSERFGICTSSRKLAEDFQDLLLSLGIYSYIQEERRGEKSYYKVVISGLDSMLKFYKIVKFTRRGRELKKFIERAMRKRNNRDVVPKEIAEKVNDLLKKVKIRDGYITGLLKRNNNLHRLKAIEYLEKIIGVCEKAKRGDLEACKKIFSIADYAKEKNISYSTARYKIVNDNDYFKKVTEIANEIEKETRKLLSFLKNIRFLRVKSIEVVKNESIRWVYDVTVEPYKNFVSHGAILHNTISIAKANIHATLKAETAVLAAANPKFGRFDPYRPIPEQIDLPPTIINRFDLIFPFKDIPDVEKDKVIVEHVLKEHMEPEEIKPEIPIDLLRKYIAYARQNIFPKFTKEAAERIKEFYLKLRSKVQSLGEGIKPIPISARQLEALIRLAEASARMHLRDKVTVEDAERAISLMKYYLKEVGLDPETGVIDIDRVMTGIPARKRDKISRVYEIIQNLSKEFPDGVPIEEILAEAEKEGIRQDEAAKIIEELKKKGDIFEPSPGKIAAI